MKLILISLKSSDFAVARQFYLVRLIAYTKDFLAFFASSTILRVHNCAMAVTFFTLRIRTWNKWNEFFEGVHMNFLTSKYPKVIPRIGTTPTTLEGAGTGSLIIAKNIPTPKPDAKANKNSLI